MHDSTVTLFNGHERRGVLLWYPTVFTGVTLTETRGDTATPDAGTVSADTVEIIIRTAADKTSRTPSGTIRQYAGPKEYAALADPSGYFTFTPQRDFIAVGDLSAAYPEPVEDEAEDDFHGFYHAMSKTRDRVYLVTDAAFFSLLPHFEVSGR